MKLRNWYAFVSVAASGPQSSPFPEERGNFLRPRMAADLRYTTADVKYYSEHWAKPNYDTGLDEKHMLLQDQNSQAVYDALVESGGWLRTFSDHQEWDGGGVTLSFAGHGREGDGALGRWCPMGGVMSG